MNDDRKDIEIISTLRKIISRTSPTQVNYRKELILPYTPDMLAMYGLMDYELIGFLMKEILMNRIHPQRNKPLDERYIFMIKPVDVSMSKTKFYRMMKELEAYGCVLKLPKDFTYLLNPIYCSTKISTTDKYELGIISESEYMAKQRYVDKLKSMR